MNDFANMSKMTRSCSFENCPRYCGSSSLGRTDGSDASNCMAYAC